MRTYVVFHIIGILLLLEGLFIALCSAWSITTGEDSGTGMLYAAVFSMLVGGFLVVSTPRVRTMYVQESIIAVVFGWASISVFGALPYLLTGYIPSCIDALFESVSGFTTTGSSILADVEILPKGLLLWRATTQFLGGMGILMFVLAVFPFVGVGGRTLLQTEYSGLADEKSVPHLVRWLRSILYIYIGITIAGIATLMICGMPFYDAITHAFPAVSTGGFSVKNASVGAYNNVAVDYVIVILMILGSMNFVIYYKMLHGSIRNALHRDDFKVNVGIIIVATTIAVALTWKSIYPSFSDAVRYCLFQVTTIGTTTGFATSDYEKWPIILQVMLVLLMIIGGSVGSTAGGIKNIRLIIAFKYFLRELKRIVHPAGVFIVKVNGITVDDDSAFKAVIFIFIYLLVITLFTFFLMGIGIDFTTAISGTAATLGNVGPGLGTVGPMDNFSSIPPTGKIAFTIAMFIGRLEILLSLVIFHPVLWKRVKIQWTMHSSSKPIK